MLPLINYMSNTFKVERGIKKPANGEKKVKSWRYPFQSMKPGDSFFVADYAARPKVASAAAYFGKRNPKYRFSICHDGDGFRVWRTK